MKNICVLFTFLPLLSLAQITETDGDWTAKYATLANTPEAELMIRTGDIDNLGFGWPIGFDPFSGSSTPAHAYPWIADEMDPPGTDRIMVISSYNGFPPYGQDGYTNGTNSPDNDVRPITLTFPPSLPVSKAELWMFIDDFQAPVWGADYQVFLDGMRNNDLENLVNSLVQTGPIGKVVTYAIPNSLLFLLLDGELNIVFDDYTTGAGDGYAVDFVKLLINPFGDINSNAHITGVVRDCNTLQPLEGVVVSTGTNLSATTDASGQYTIFHVNPGLVQLSTSKPGYGSAYQIVEIQTNQTITVDFNICSPAPQLIYHDPFAGETNVALNRTVKMVFDQPIDPATFNATSFLLSDQQQNIPGTFSVNQDTLIFTPSSLLPGNNYRATITTNLKNTFGVSVAQNFEFYFSTAGTTSTKENQALLPLKVAPNPFSDFFYVDFKGSAEYYVLSNHLGQVVQKGLFSNPIQFQSTLTPGIYYFYLYNREHKMVGREKVVKG